MKGFFRRILLSTAALLALGAARADEASFEINTPLIVTAGEMFRVEFVLEGKADDDTFRAPEFDGLDVLAGPTAATGYQYQNINGVSSQKTTLTITYVVMARNAGTVTIGAASIDAKGRTYTTKATPIEVVDEGAAERREGEDRAAEQGNAVKNKVAKDDILLRLNLSRASVYKGEPLRASLTLYTRVGIAGFENVKLPSFNGFWSQEPAHRQLHDQPPDARRQGLRHPHHKRVSAISAAGGHADHRSRRDDGHSSGGDPQQQRFRSFLRQRRRRLQRAAQGSRRAASRWR